ncbi:hypothetical protein GCM10028786_21250 [Flaviaesturariibacter terrae]
MIFSCEKAGENNRGFHVEKGWYAKKPFNPSLRGAGAAGNGDEATGSPLGACPAPQLPERFPKVNPVASLHFVSLAMTSLGEDPRYDVP